MLKHAIREAAQHTYGGHIFQSMEFYGSWNEWMCHNSNHSLEGMMGSPVLRHASMYEQASPRGYCNSRIPLLVVL
jgi:hypothetical protein